MSRGATYYVDRNVFENLFNKKGYALADFCEFSNVSSGSIYNIRKHQAVAMPTIKRLAAYFNCDFRYLIEAQKTDWGVLGNPNAPKEVKEAEIITVEPVSDVLVEATKPIVKRNEPAKNLLEGIEIIKNIKQGEELTIKSLKENCTVPKFSCMMTSKNMIVKRGGTWITDNQIILDLILGKAVIEDGN